MADDTAAKLEYAVDPDDAVDVLVERFGLPDDAVDVLVEHFGFDPRKGEEPPPLHRDLVPYLTEQNGFTALKHPLVFSMMHSTMQNGWANKFYEQKKRAVRESREAGAWHHYVFLHERPYRFEAFQGIADELSDADYWNLLGDIWTDSENLWQDVDAWQEALESERAGRDSMMTDAEREKRDALPEVVTVFRGTCAPDGMGCGFSWTTDQTRAEWFAKRLHTDDKDEPTLIVGRVARRDIIACFDGRGEEEVVCLPERVAVVERFALTEGAASDRNRIIAALLGGTR